MDNLEKYVKNNRSEFDSEQPSERVWEGIREALPGQSQESTSKLWIWRVAAAVLLLTTSYLAWDKWQSGADPNVIAETLSLGEEFDQAETYYLQQIEGLQVELTNYSSAKPLTNDFSADLQGLDSMYTAMKKEFVATGDHQRVADALIQNLRIRMEILNQQLLILKRIKRQTEDEDIEI